MLVHCSECNTTADVKLDRRSEKPICTSCNKEVTGLSSFIIKTMKDQKDFVEHKKESFAFHCDNCKEVHGGVLSENKEYVQCVVCNKKMNISAHMLNAMKTLKK